MAKRRELKRSINYICSDLFAECMAASLYNGTPNPEDVKNLLTSILTMHSSYICRVSHVEPGMKASVYFQDLKTHFNKDVNDVILYAIVRMCRGPGFDIASCGV